MMSYSVFISYWRSDTEGIAGRLYDRLATVLPAEKLFIDVDSITKGADFVAAMTRRVSQSDVVLAVIGPGWLTAADAAGARRLDDAHDPVRMELERALKEDKIVIPVLVGRADMPPSKQLPKALRPLARRNAERLTHENFLGDAERLLLSIEAAVAERQQTVGAQQDADLDGAAQQPSLTPEEMELSEWQAISLSQDPEQIRNHLARWPEGATTESAYRHLEELDWARLSASPDANTVNWFLSAYPYGKYRPDAEELLARMKVAMRPLTAGPPNGPSIASRPSARLQVPQRPAPVTAAPRHFHGDCFCLWAQLSWGGLDLRDGGTEAFPRGCHPNQKSPSRVR